MSSRASGAANTLKDTDKSARQVLQQRGSEATKNLRTTLQLPVNLNDNTILGTALAEIATEESRNNPLFAAKVRERYAELLGQNGGTRKRSLGNKQFYESMPPLVPIRRIDGYVHDPFAPPDPHLLIQLYGKDQLSRALFDYTVDMLKQVASKIEQKHPGTKPSNRGKRDALIAYIVQYAE